MIIDILTLFPESFSYLNSSILKRAQESNKIQINLIDIREFSKDKHKKCDDYPFVWWCWCWKKSIDHGADQQHRQEE